MFFGYAAFKAPASCQRRDNAFAIDREFCYEFLRAPMERRSSRKTAETWKSSASCQSGSTALASEAALRQRATWPIRDTVGEGAAHTIERAPNAAPLLRRSRSPLGIRNLPVFARKRGDKRARPSPGWPCNAQDCSRDGPDSLHPNDRQESRCRLKNGSCRNWALRPTNRRRSCLYPV